MILTNYYKSIYQKRPFKFLSLMIQVFFLISFSPSILAQNLVPNPSFEELIDFSKVNLNGWHKVQKSDSPDYFNLGITHPVNNIFDEYIGGTIAKTGTGFIGIFCYRLNPDRNIKNIREFIESPLNMPLEKDSLYKVSFSICPDNESNMNVKNFGVYFCPTALQLEKDEPVFKISPQLEFNFYFPDSMKNWISLQAFYKAGGKEKFIILGNFKNDRNTRLKSMRSARQKGKEKKWNMVPGEKGAYYYIDDVEVSKVTLVKAPIIKEITGTEAKEDTFNINELKLDTAIVLNNIVFDFNKSDLLPQSYPEINKLFRLMTSNPKLRIKLEGHTDNVGGYLFNLQLSLRRVESVAGYLVEKGIEANRLEFAGYSYTVPVASNETEEGRRLNRRVAFKIIEK
jgi:OmpA-OmpF porin, OOP family